MRGKVKNKNARHGYCLGDLSQEPDYENKKGRIIRFADYTTLQNLRNAIKEIVGEELLAEANFYYDKKKCYIGYHGDRERRKVIGCRIGDSFPLRFKWMYKHKQVGRRLDIILNGGDMYFMSDKAVGHDWLKSSILTLRHAAGEKGYKI